MNHIVLDPKDLRSWLATLENEGELKICRAKVECGSEIQEIARQMSARQGPAVVFENILGYENNWCSRLFVGSLNSNAKLALALGLPKNTTEDGVVNRLLATLNRPVEPQHLTQGSIQQNVISKEDVDLNTLPVPQWHPHDQGRYINTWAAVVTRDPETGQTNVGAYRGVIHDRNHIGVLLLCSQGWGIHFEKYTQRGEPMPIACVYGWDPSLMLAAGSPVTTVDEWRWMGAIREAPVGLVPCQTVDLEVPASAEIVIEGWLTTDRERFANEGPFREKIGYGRSYHMPQIEVSCICHRDNPIMVGSATGLAPIVEEQALVINAGVKAVLLNALHSAGIPNVLDLSLAPYFACQIKKSYQGHAYQVACTLFGHKALNMNYKMLFVVEDDVDLKDGRALMAAINAHVDPQRDIHIFPTQRTLVDPAMSQQDHNYHIYGGSGGSKVLIDATRNWLDQPPSRTTPAKATEPAYEIVEKVQSRWKEYGFD